jgi:hypothetical protein
MGISEAEQRVCELIALINCQLRLIRNLEECGKDLTSAKIVFDSLRVSLFLATQDWHRARCQGELDQIGNNADHASLVWERDPSLVLHISGQRHTPRWIGREASMKAEESTLDFTNEIGTKEVKDEFNPSIVPGLKVEEKKASSEGHFEFRALTDEEKKDFVNSLNSDGKRFLAQLAAKTARSGDSAA